MNQKRTWMYCHAAHNGPDCEEVLDGQRFLLEAYAKENDFEIVGSSSDIGTGLTLDRPGLQAFMDAMESETVDVLLIPTLDRLSRDTDKVIQFWNLLHERGVHVHTAIDGEIDLSINAMVREMARK